MSKITREEFDALVGRVNRLEAVAAAPAAPPRDAEPNDNAEPGTLAGLGHVLGDVNDYIEGLTATQRRQGDLPVSGPVYFVTDDAVAEAAGRGLTGAAKLLRHLQSLRQFGAANVEDTRIYLPIAGRYELDRDGNFGEMVAPWPNTRVFPPGVKDSEVLDAVRWRVESNANTNPDQKFPG